MPYFFIILFKINLVLVLFAAAYYLILRRLTFYVINRIFLMFGILFSTVYPLINLTDFFKRPEFVPQLNRNVNSLVEQSSVYWSFLTLLFYIGVLLMALRLIVQFTSLYQIHKKSAPGRVGDYDVRILEDKVSPFSFWKTIYINPLLHQPGDLSNILEHENVHVKELHTIDIILAEICVVFYWFNPGVWLMKKAVKENIEFITDAKILKKGIDKKSYQYSLLHTSSLTPSVAIINNFNLSDLKIRIQMMNAKRSSHLNLSRYLFVLPVLLLFTLAFTIKKRNDHLMPVQKGVTQEANHEIEPPKSASTEIKVIYPVTIKKPNRKTLIKDNLFVLPEISHHINLNNVTFKSDSISKISFPPQENTTPVREVKIIAFKKVSANKDGSINTPIFLDSLNNGKMNIRVERTDLPSTEHKRAIISRLKVNGIPTNTYTLIADTLNNTKAMIFLDGQKLSDVELKNKMTTDKIKNIVIKKGVSGEGIYIRTKD